MIRQWFLERHGSSTLRINFRDTINHPPFQVYVPYSKKNQDTYSYYFAVYVSVCLCSPPPNFIVFYNVRALSKESRRSLLRRTSCYLKRCFGNLALSSSSSIKPTLLEAIDWPQIPHDLNWDWNRVAAVGNRWLTAWATWTMPRPAQWNHTTYFLGYVGVITRATGLWSIYLLLIF
jgi:hypothetical protein